jgi:hypothetical protein
LLKRGQATVKPNLFGKSSEEQREEDVQLLKSAPEPKSSNLASKAECELRSILESEPTTVFRGQVEDYPKFSKNGPGLLKARRNIAA